VWGSTPPIDVQTGTVFFATGNNYDVPDDYDDCIAAATNAAQQFSCNNVNASYSQNWFDSVLAVDIMTGDIKWGKRLDGYDGFNGACFEKNNPNCPTVLGADWDFGMAPILDTVNDRKVLFVGQKSGIVWSFDATTGQTLWSTQAAPAGIAGGVSWGAAIGTSHVYYSAANSLNQNWVLNNGTVVQGGGWLALDKVTGQVVWTTANPAFFDTSGNNRNNTAACPGPPTVVNDVVFVTSLDSVYENGIPVYGHGGFVYALKAENGEIISSFETGAGVYGGWSFADGCAYVGSGYARISAAAGRFLYGFCFPPY